MPREETKRALIVVRTYPVPYSPGVESSCTAAITDKGEWLRLFPVHWRLLRQDQRFRKYQWVEVRVTKAEDDARPESFRLRQDGIRVLPGRKIGSSDWQAKKAHVLPMSKPSLCAIRRQRDLQQFPTLGVFRPAQIRRLRIVPTEPAWSEAELGMLRQTHLFVRPPTRELEKIPFHFCYEFLCNEPDCNGHNLMCTDWEISESYRKWRREYGDSWEAKFRERYEEQMIRKYDTHFFVGTVASHPGSWIIIGLFYPPMGVASAQASLF